MVMPNIPSELVEEILSRVPAISLRRLGATCKRWNSLSRDPGFSEKHFRRAPKEPRCVFMLKEYRVCLTRVNLKSVSPAIELRDALSLEDTHSNNSKQVCIALVYHCDGLLLCITKDHRLVVWNPCLGETRWIQTKNGYTEHSMLALGYECNQSCRSYKIFMNGYTEPDGFEIYEFSSNSWSVVNAPNCFEIGSLYPGVTLKGNAYWISSDVGYLLCFDFTRERFKRFCLPHSLSRRKALSVFREEENSVLCYAYFNVSGEVEMWVTNQIDDTEADLSWSKFAVDLLGPSVDFFAFTSLLIDVEKKVALCCNYCSCPSRNDDVSYLKDRWLLHFSHRNNGSWWPFLFNYVPSLVHIQSE